MTTKKNKKRKNIISNQNNNQRPSLVGIEITAVSSNPNDMPLTTCRYYKNGKCTQTFARCKRTSNPDCIHSVDRKYNSGYIGDNHTKTRPTIRSGTYHTEERYGNNQVIDKIDCTDKIATVYLFKGILTFSKSIVVDRTLLVKDILSDKVYSIGVAYNITDKKYYLSYTQFYYYKKRGYSLQLRIILCNAGTENFNTLFQFQEFSDLALYGYSVGKTSSLNAKDRHKILSHIIDNHIMYRWQIISHLQGLIALREDRTNVDFSLAIKQWEDDIMFVSNYSRDTL